MARKKLIWFQIIFVLAFLLQPIVFPVRPDDMERFLISREIVKNILANLLIVIFFYINYLYLIPKFFFIKKYFYYFISVLACLCAILFISSTLTYELPSSRRPHLPPPIKHNISEPPDFDSDINLHQRIEPGKKQSLLFKVRFYFTENDQIFFLFISIVCFSLLLRIHNKYYQTENAKKEAEMNYLLAQINPHFLFNALNSIFTLTVKEKAQKSSTSLLKLSELMRYLITETHNNFVPLENEINCVSDFIELQKLRLTENVQLHYEINGTINNKQIAPMLLIPFIENSFKYGVSPDENSEIFINIDIIENSLKMIIRNNKVSVFNDFTEKSRMGIQNVKKRLQLIYPDKYKLFITEDEKIFQVSLTIFLL